MAALAVFSITELLEQIFLDLPCRDVLVHRRVAKCWKATVHGSQVLRNGIFLTTKPSDKASLDPTYTSYSYQTHTRGQYRFSLPDRNLTANDVNTALVPATHQVHINPLLCHAFPIHPVHGKPPIKPCGHFYKPGQYQSMPALWRDMYLTQPTTGIVWVDIMVGNGGHVNGSEYVLRSTYGLGNRRGVTLEDLMEQVEVAAQRSPGKSVYFRIDIALGNG